MLATRSKLPREMSVLVIPHESLSLSRGSLTAGLASNQGYCIWEWIGQRSLGGDAPSTGPLSTRDDASRPSLSLSLPESSSRLRYSYYSSELTCIVRLVRSVGRFVGELDPRRGRTSESVSAFNRRRVQDPLDSDSCAKRGEKGCPLFRWAERRS